MTFSRSSYRHIFIDHRHIARPLAGDLPIEFVQQNLTSYSGLKLVRRDLRRLVVMPRLRRTVAEVPSDYGGARLALLVVALLYVGARRLEHLRHLAGDPFLARFCGPARFPTAHTVSNWLEQFTEATLAPLIQLNHELVIEAVTKLRLPRLTLDVDGRASASAVLRFLPQGRGTDVAETGRKSLRLRSLKNCPAQCVPRVLDTRRRACQALRQ